jgi:hypothetical protein
MLFKLPAIVAFASTLVLARHSHSRLARSTVGFGADSSINVTGILHAAQKSVASGKDVLATFAAASGPEVHIFGDWLHLDGVSAFHWTSDMEVDCDGKDVSQHMTFLLVSHH